MFANAEMETEEGDTIKGNEHHSGSASAHESSTMPSEWVSRDARGEITDVDEPSENDGAVATDTCPDGSPEDIVGFSIGQEQLRMKSPTTPAYEKVRALDQSKDYFNLDAEEEEIDQGADVSEIHHNHGKDSCPSRNALGDKVPVSPTYPHPSCTAPPQASSRSNTSKSILKDGLGSRTRRASAGANGMVGTLKKMLPELPSIPFSKAPSLPNFGFWTRSKEEHQLNRPRRSGTMFARGNLPWASPAPPPDRAVSTTELMQSPTRESGSRSGDIPAEKDQADEGAERSPRYGLHQLHVPPWNGPNPRLLRRATSESSLFMRHELERSATQDDAEKWASVSEQINSRFKAITDSFQDSAIRRMPKMPSASLGSFKPSLQQSDSDTVGAHTRRNLDIAYSNAQPDYHVQNKSTPHAGKPTKHAHPILSRAVADLRGDVVTLGGYRGSILRSAKPPHKQLWVPVKVGMNLRRVDLEVGLYPEDEEKMEDKIIPSGVLSHIGPVDICRRLLRKLKKASRARPDELRVHNYGYDWRLSPHLLSRQLVRFLESLDCNRSGTTCHDRGAVVIAHSLGGLITRHAVNQRPDLFAGVVYAGVPQHCVNILGPLRNGDEVLLSSRVLTAQVNFTLRTSYALLPESGRCFIDKTTGERYDIDFFDVKTWQEHCLSPCVSNSATTTRPEPRKSLVETLSESFPSLPLTNKRNSIFRRENSSDQEHQSSLEEVTDAANHSAKSSGQRADGASTAGHSQPLEPSMDSSPPPANRESVSTACTLPRAEALAYLERTLRSVRDFKQELAFNPSHQAADVYPPIAVLYSSSVPTVFGARVDSREAIKRSDAYDNLAFAAGDGIVLSKSARPPEGYKIVRGGLVRSERGHIGLLGDLEAVGKCLGAIGDARRRGVGTGAFAMREAEQES